ncbi:type II toxin-antitoxin system RelE/ParE family toxin [Streptomyces parvus]|uniref:type II toxin-antitoxin system RelE family toxin n=1 Tax=Streptomyces parvus TaxID=66428 RepID=UPI003821FA8F
MYELRFTDDADATLTRLEGDGAATATKLKKVRKALAYLQSNPRHPGLHSHQYESFPGYGDQKVWDSYVENHVPGAWRIYWRYGPNEKNDRNEEVSIITVLVIGPHL